MSRIDRTTPAEEIAALVSQALQDAGITAALSGGGAVSVYSRNEYESVDLDFVTSAGSDAIAAAIGPLGFEHVTGARQFEHPDSQFYVEFPPGPIAFGETTIRDSDVPTLSTSYGPLRIVSPTHSVMDRLAAFVHWNDRQAFDQAVMVAHRQAVDWAALTDWALREGIDPGLIDRVRRRAGSSWVGAVDGGE